MTTETYKNPTWWDTENDSAWERLKVAFKRDWDQTKHDMGGREPDTNQKAGDTLKQAAGKEAIPPRHQPTFHDVEPAYRYGYGARLHYGDEYPEWDDELEARLKQEWTTLDPARKARWDSDVEAIHHAWDFEE